MLIVLRVVPRVDLCFTRIGGTKGVTNFSFEKKNLKEILSSRTGGKKQQVS